MTDTKGMSVRMKHHSVSCAFSLSSFGAFIQNIVSDCSSPKVGWIYTRWIIATGAIMKNANAVWNNSVVNNPREFVGTNSSSVNPEMPIPELTFAPCPQPALARLYRYKLPKAFYIAWRWLDYLIAGLDDCFRFIHTMPMTGLSDGRSATTGAHCAPKYVGYT